MQILTCYFMKKGIRLTAAIAIIIIFSRLALQAQLPVLVKDINTMPAVNAGNGIFPQMLTDVNGRLYFYGQHPVEGPEIYVSDGSSAGTHLLVSINETNPLSMFNVNGTCFFY